MITGLPSMVPFTILWYWASFEIYGPERIVCTALNTVLADGDVLFAQADPQKIS